MTKERTTKARIRARMDKTGERYTAARRHVLSEPAPRDASVSAKPVAETPPTAPTKSTTPVESRGAVSEARVLERTGTSLARWFSVLDAFDAVTKGHTAAARHLRDDHGVDAWYSQGITVAYERAKGLRGINERPGGTFEFNVTKVLRATVAAVAKAIEQATARAAWTSGIEAAVTDAIGRGGALAKKASGARRLRVVCGEHGEVELVVNPKGEDKSQLVVTHRKLADRAALERHRAAWKRALDALSERFSR
ncbi:MAG: hypothetical protein JNK05_16420 [Myxococcales bacterium]|nr:hypothetical protein [Myxococcales bacterium]